MVQSDSPRVSRKAGLVQARVLPFKSIAARMTWFWIATLLLFLVFLPCAGAQLYTASVT